MLDLPAILQQNGIHLIKTGHKYKCKCYMHEDSNPSMSVSQDESGKWWAHCFVCEDGVNHDDIAAYMHFTGCDFKTATKAIGRDTAKMEIKAPEKSNKWKDTIPPVNHVAPNMNNKMLGDPSMIWTYRNADDVIVGYVARYDPPGQAKEFRPYTFGSMSENLSPEWAARAWANPRPIYNAHKLAQNPNAQVIIVEGEKACDAAERLLPGVVCITWHGGSNAVSCTGWDDLKDRNVIIIPDADIPGENAAQWLAKHLLGIGASKVSVVDSSNQPKGWDLADALMEGWDTERTIKWAQEHKQVATIEPVHPVAARQAAVDRALSIVPDIDVVSVESNIVPVQVGNVIAMQAQRLELAPALPPEFSEIALARSWSETYGLNWCYTSAWNQWTQWDGTRWVVDKRNSVTSITCDAMVAASNWPGALNIPVGQRRSICSKKNIANVLSIAGSFKRHATIPEDWDSDPWLLGTPGGVIDLRTGIMREAKREDRITKFTACTPKAGNKPYWDSVISRLCDGDEHLYDYYKRWCGYLLTGDTREEALLFCLGVGQSGKTKFIMALHEILGDYAATADIEMFMESKFQRHTEEVASLYGARMVHCTEPEAGSRWKESLIKKMTGREIIQARRLYQSQFEFKPQFKLVIGANFRPSLKSVGVEMTRRLHVLQFPPTIPMEERIIDLDVKLREEYPAILAWMIEGCLEWQKHGLGKPDHVKAAVSQYMESEDSIGEWIDEHIERVEGGKELIGEVYTNYQNAIEAGGEHALGKKRFIQAVEERGWRRIRANGTRYFADVRLKQKTGKASWYE